MHIKRTKHQPSSQRQASSESFYDEAFKLFAQGFSNQKIEKYNQSDLTIRELLEPSIELVLDEIEGKVTKNVKFQKTTSYFVKRKQFISDIINKRNSKGFSRDEMQFFNEFLKICEYYHQNRSLDEYVYLKLELIFDRIYYSHKKKKISKVQLVSEHEQELQVEEENGEEIYPVRPSKREKKSNEQVVFVSKPKQEKKVTTVRKKEEKKTIIVPIKNEEQLIPVPQVKNFTSELQRKKKNLEVLELEHQILLKKSKMLQVQAEINQMESQINKMPETTNTSIHTPNKNSPLPASNKQNLFSAYKKKEATKVVIRQQMDQQPNQTIISSDSIQPAKVEEEEQQEDEENIEELFNAEAEEDDQSQYKVQRLTRKRSIVKSKLKKKKKSKQQKRGSIMSIQAKNKAPILLKKIDPNFLKAKSPPPQSQIEPLEQSKIYKIKRSSKRQLKIIVPRQDYYSRHWTPQQQKCLISHLQNINFLGLPTIQSKLNKQFGKKDRFRVTSIKDKKIAMFRECRKRFLNELQKRQLISEEYFSNVVQHLHCLDNRASFDFVSKFLQNYFFSDIDTMLNKAFKDTYATILKLKKRPKKYNTDSCDWQENAENIGQSQSYFPSRQESHPNANTKPTFKREINRLGITENDILETRKTINFNKQVKELTVMKEQINPVKQIDTYFEEDMEEKQPKVKEEAGKEEAIGVKTGANMKNAFQKYKEEVIDK